MRLFIVNNKVISDIIENLTVEDKIKDIAKNVILKFDYEYIHFIYGIFSAYTTYYFSIVDENSNLGRVEVEDICGKFSQCNVAIDLRHVFMADVYDILYVTSSWEKSKFKHYFYEDMFSRLQNIYGTEIASSHMEDVFEILETIFISIEETIIFGLVQSEAVVNNVTVYTEIMNNSLMIYVL